MRMWMVGPERLCRQHLLGEHKELHMLAGCLRLGKNITGYITKGLVEIHSITDRHEEIAGEMIKRGYNHKSPLGDFPYIEAGKIDIAVSEGDLRSRCRQCFQ